MEGKLLLKLWCHSCWKWKINKRCQVYNFLPLCLHPQRICSGKQQWRQNEWTSHLPGSGATSGQTHSNSNSLTCIHMFYTEDILCCANSPSSVCPLQYTPALAYLCVIISLQFSPLSCCSCIILLMVLLSKIKQSSRSTFLRTLKGQFFLFPVCSAIYQSRLF